MDQVESVVIGAGVVGMAIARSLACAGHEVLVIEAAERLGLGTTGRGSGVIHAGLYYPSQSLKARFCVAGRRALYEFAQNFGVTHRRLGKLVVATNASEDAALARIIAQAKVNGVEDLQQLTPSEAKALEPALRCTSAVYSPSTGVIDALALVEALQAEAETNGAVVAFSASLVGAERGERGFVLEIDGASPMLVSCRNLVNAAGHGAPQVARTIRGLPDEEVPSGYFAKGNYFRLDAPAPFSRLIYPVPVPGGIGTHLTIDVAGTARFGPDVEWIEALDYGVDPRRAATFYADIRRWWPDLPDDALKPDYAGVRPKISGPGEPACDFRIDGPSAHGIEGLVNLFGIESPGLTSSLAIAEHVGGLLPRPVISPTERTVQ